MPYWAMLLRRAESEDAMGVAGVHVRSWQIAYRGLLPEEYLAGLRPEEWALRYDFASPDPLKPRTIVAMDGGAIRGFATMMPSREPDLPGYWELCALYVEPEYWGRRIGMELILAARAQMQELGLIGRFCGLWRGTIGRRAFTGEMAGCRMDF